MTSALVLGLSLMVATVPVQADQKPAVIFQLDSTPLGEGTLLDVRVVQPGDEITEPGCFMPSQTCIEKAQQQSMCGAERNACREENAKLRQAIQELPDPTPHDTSFGRVLIGGAVGIALGLAAGFFLARQGSSRNP